MKETDIKEIYETIKEREEAKEHDTLTKVPKTVKIWLATGFGLIVVFVVMDYITLKMAIVYGLVGLVALKFIYGDLGSGRELTEKELAQMLYASIREEQTNPVGGMYRISPYVKSRVERAGRRVRYNGIPEERRFLVSFFNPRTKEKEWWEYSLDLYTGDICKASHLYGGPRQFDTRDVKVIVSEEIKDKKRTYAELGIKPRRPQEG